MCHEAAPISIVNFNMAELITVYVNGKAVKVYAGATSMIIDVACQLVDKGYQVDSFFPKVQANSNQVGPWQGVDKNTKYQFCK